MKKAFFSLCLIALVLPIFADDAIVLPKGVFRFRVIPSYSMTSDKVYDNGGKSVTAAANESTVTVLSSAFELGVVDPVTLGLQWAPGYYVASNFANPQTGFEKMVLTGPADLQIGAKIEAVGDQGIIKNDMVRLAFTPGVGIPLDSYDAQKEFDNLAAGKDFRPMSSSEHQSVYLGLKADGDYIINDMFFLNLHGQAYYFLPNESLQFETVVTNAFIAASLGQATADAMEPLTKTKSEFGIETMFEFEPHAKFALSSAASLNVGLPFTFNYNLADKTTYNGTNTTSDPKSLLTVGPNVSLFTKIGPLPVEAEVQYVLPLLGTNNAQTSTLSLQVKIFGKVY